MEQWSIGVLLQRVFESAHWDARSQLRGFLRRADAPQRGSAM